MSPKELDQHFCAIFWIPYRSKSSRHYKGGETRKKIQKGEPRGRKGTLKGDNKGERNKRTTCRPPQRIIPHDNEVTVPVAAEVNAPFGDLRRHGPAYAGEEAILGEDEDGVCEEKSDGPKPVDQAEPMPDVEDVEEEKAHWCKERRGYG